MRTAGFQLRCAVGVIAGWLLGASTVSAQSFPQFTAVGGGNGTPGGGTCTIVSAGGVDSPTPVAFQEDCPVRFGAASASPGALSTSAHARNIGNSVLIEENMLAKFDDQVVFTSTDPNATIATVSLNLDFATRLHSVNSAAARMEGSVLFGGLYLITVVLNSGNAPPGNFFIDENAFTKTNDTGGFTGPDTYEQHVSLRTPEVVVPLNQPVVLKLSIKASAFALDNGLSDVEFATLGLPTGIDVFTLPAGVTVNAPGSFLVDNRFVPPTPDISVAPTSYDFGNVNLGSSANTLVTISNTGGLDLTVSGIGLENGSSSAIAVTQAPALPAVIHPGGTVDIQLTYTPATTLGDQAILDITSDDPDQGAIRVGLGGAGIPSAIPPLQRIAEIIAFIDASAGNGSLVGTGANVFSGRGRLGALRNMIVAAGDLIRDGFFAEACGQLRDAEQRTDAVPKPPDFVTGPAAVDLRSFISRLRSELGCQ